MYKILVTSGGTQEYIDDVRVLTNVSSGKLGALIATNFLSQEDVHVSFVFGKNTMTPFDNLGVPQPDHNDIHLYPVRSAQDVLEVMKRLAPEMDAIIHCMAVSDFTFKRDVAVKLKSNDMTAFIEYIARTITLNPKIISQVKLWNPKVILVGFKFEVGASHEELASLAQASIEKNGCDLVIANDKKEMEQAREHAAHFFYSSRMKEWGFKDISTKGKGLIAVTLTQFIMNALKNNATRTCET
jgi:phosphopantothenate-cysteine ligase